MQDQAATQRFTDRLPMLFEMARPERCHDSGMGDAIDVDTGEFVRVVGRVLLDGRDSAILIRLVGDELRLLVRVQREVEQVGRRPRVGHRCDDVREVVAEAGAPAHVDRVRDRRVEGAREDVSARGARGARGGRRRDARFGRLGRGGGPGRRRFRSGPDAPGRDDRGDGDRDDPSDSHVCLPSERSVPQTPRATIGLRSEPSRSISRITSSPGQGSARVSRRGSPAGIHHRRCRCRERRRAAAIHRQRPARSSGRS